LTDRLNEISEFLVQNNICTEEELQLVRCISGYSEETMNAIIYARTAYHDVEQLYDCEPENFDFSMCSFLSEEEEESDD